MLKAFAKQVDRDLLDCYAANLDGDLGEIFGNGADDETEKKRRRKAKLLDDLPTSIRKDFQNKRRKNLLDDVPDGIKEAAKKRREGEAADKQQEN